MKRIYSSSNPIGVRNAAAFLEQNGFRVTVQGEDRWGSAGGIPPIECWPELMLLDETQEAAALECLKRYREGARTQTGAPPWRCAQCGEELEAQFSECWRCQPRLPSDQSTTELRQVRHWFHLLLLIHIATTLVAGTLSVDTYRRVPEEVYYFAVRSFHLSSETNRQLYFLYWIATLVQWFGLMLRFNFARYLALFLSAYGLLYTLWAEEFSVMSGLELTFSTINNLSVGALVVLVFFSPLRADFSGSTGSAAPQ